MPMMPGEGNDNSAVNTVRLSELEREEALAYIVRRARHLPKAAIREDTTYDVVLDLAEHLGLDDLMRARMAKRRGEVVAIG